MCTASGLDAGFFARLIWQESRFDPNALSHANARGIAQFIPSTALLRGLKDPYNPADALEHSAHYLAEMARNRRLTPVKRVDPPPPALKPWGVQLGFGTSQRAAKTKIASQTRTCTGQVGREKLDLIYVKNRVSGKKGYYFARIGRNTREAAQKLCNSLKQQRCSCLVVENK